MSARESKRHGEARYRFRSMMWMENTVIGIQLHDIGQTTRNQLCAPTKSQLQVNTTSSLDPDYIFQVQLLLQVPI